MAAKRTPPSNNTKSPEAQLDAFLAKFDDSIEALARACLAWMRALAPGAMVRVYDAYNALSIGFATGDSLHETFAAVVVYPKHVNIAFNQGATLKDPRGVLVGTGTSMRHVRVDDVTTLDDAYLAKLVRAAAKHSGHKSKLGERGPTRIVAIYARQRPRRPPKTKM